MKSILIDKLGNKKELNYYDIENECIEIINNSSTEIKSKFNEYKKKYSYFTAYFDFVILELGYSIENSMGTINSLLKSNDNKIYILSGVNYDRYIKNIDKIKYPICEWFTKCDDKTLGINPVTYDKEKFDNGLVDRNNIFISNGDMYTHLDLANLIVNQMLIKSELAYKTYVNFESAGNKSINFLESEFGFLRFGFNEKVLLEYMESSLSNKQRDYISYLNSNNYVDFSLNKDEIIKTR